MCMKQHTTSLPNIHHPTKSQIRNVHFLYNSALRYNFIGERFDFNKGNKVVILIEKVLQKSKDKIKMISSKN